MDTGNLTRLLIQALKLTGLEFGLLLGPGLGLGLIMHPMAGALARQSRKMAGRLVDWLLWPGVLVHELAHGAVGLVFFHRIRSISLGGPGKNRGQVVLGHRSGNLFQKIGLFFIGIAPILFGAALIHLAAERLMPGLLPILPGTVLDPAAMALNALSAVSRELLQVRHLGRWEFYLFLYLIFVLGTQMRLSPADLRGAGYGLFFLALALFAMNLVFGFGRTFPEIWSLYRLNAVAVVLSAIYAVMALVLVLDLLLWLLLTAASLKRT